jgi:zinc/manganese transport system substrate-binding protein
LAAPFLPFRPWVSSRRQAWSRRFLLLPGTLALLLLAACRAPGSGSAPSASPAPPEGPRRLRVVTTVLPITLFTRAVASGCAAVEPLLPSDVGPHDVQTSPSQLARLRDADVLVINGLGLETFLDKLIAAAGQPQLRVIDASRGIPTLASSKDAPSQDGEDHGHDHGHDHAHGAVNPHVWLDPQRAARQVATIRDGLVAADPPCRQRYTANAAALLAELGRLDADLARQLAPYAGRAFVAFHDTAPYFAERYRLQAHFLVDVPEENPSPADLQRVTRLVRDADLRALLAEPQAAGRSFQSLARDLGLKVAVFDPMETGPAAATGGHYAETMRRNGNELVRAFGG